MGGSGNIATANPESFTKCNMNLLVSQALKIAQFNCYYEFNANVNAPFLAGGYNSDLLTGSVYGKYTSEWYTAASNMRLSGGNLRLEFILVNAAVISGNGCEESLEGVFIFPHNTGSKSCATGADNQLLDI